MGRRAVKTETVCSCGGLALQVAVQAPPQLAVNQVLLAVNQAPVEPDKNDEAAWAVVMQRWPAYPQSVISGPHKEFYDAVAVFWRGSTLHAKTLMKPPPTAGRGDPSTEGGDGWVSCPCRTTKWWKADDKQGLNGKNFSAST
jgi:hypothetical protein